MTKMNINGPVTQTQMKLISGDKKLSGSLRISIESVF
jgi:hypothetical protein